MRARLLLAPALLLLLAVGCRPLLDSPAAPQDAVTAVPVTVVTACISSPSANQMALVYADRTGIFEQHGLAVDLITFNSGTTAATALVTGDVDICQVAGAPVLNAILAGEDLVYIGGLINRHVYSVVTSADIETAADLPGTTFAISRPGGLGDAIMRIAIRQWGLEADKDIALLSVGNQSERLAALESGAVDGAILAIPATSQAEELGYPVFLDLGDLDLFYPSIVVATRRDFLAENRPVAVQFMTAVAESVAAMHADRDGTIRIMAEYLQLDPDDDAALLAEAYEDLVLERMESAPYVNTDGVANLIELARQENPDTPAIDPATLVDHSVVDDVFADRE